MKEVLLSIKPKRCELIASGKETIEVRKTRPKIDTPFKCYIYCTKKYYRDGDGYFQGKYCGKVIGEFVCDRIHPVVNAWTKFMYENCDQYTRKLDSCLSLSEMQNYLRHKKGYGWHISNLVIYDEPKELSGFNTFCKGNGSEKDKRCIGCSRLCFDNEPINGYTRWCGVHKRKPLTRPPQSWCYVEKGDGKDGN